MIKKYLSLILIFTLSLVPQEGRPGWLMNAIPKPIACMTILSTIPSVREEGVDPLNSVRQIQNLLKSESGIPSDLIDPGYRQFSLLVGNIGKQKLPEESVFQALNRLEAIEMDLASINFEGLSVAHEIRGWKSIEAMWQKIELQIAESEDRMKGKLRGLLPRLRPQTLLDGIIAFIFSESAMAFMQTPLMPSEFIESLVLTIGSLLYFSSRFYHWFEVTDQKLVTHLRQIMKTLNNKGDWPLSIYSENFSLSTELHEAMMQSQGELDPEIENLAIQESARNYHSIIDFLQEIVRVRGQYGDLTSYQMEMARRNPEGQYRFVYVDQVFYIDPNGKNGQPEPVWFFVYRAFKENPHKPKRPRRDSGDFRKRIQEMMFPGLQPDPIPVRN